MPEMPEVEAVCRKLRRDAVGAKIVKARIERLRITTLQDPAEVEALAIGRTIESVTRRRSEEHTSELQSHSDLVCRLLREKTTSAVARAAPERAPSSTRSSAASRCSAVVWISRPRRRPRSTRFPYTTLFRSKLRRDAVGAKIVKARIERLRITTPQDPAEVEALAIGRTIESVTRR